MIKQQYNYEYLQQFCEDNEIELEIDYSKDKITRDSIIRGKCKSEGCSGVFEKNFRQIVESENFGCLLCVNKIKIKRLTDTKKEQSKYNIEYLQQFCKEHNITLRKDYSKENITRNTIINGKCIYNNCKNGFAKKFSSLEQDKNFGCETCSVKIKRERSENTCIQKFGETNAMYSADIKEKYNKSMTELFNGNPMFLEEIKLKQQETVYKNYGVKNVSQNEKIKQKKIETCLINNGTEYPGQNKDIQAKMTQTTFKNLGVLHNSQSDKIKQQKIITCLENYGCEHPSQNTEVMDKMSKNAYKLKDYVLPSGNIIKIQGYEHYALDQILRDGILETDIINGCSNVPDIWYEDESGKKHRHYVDIFIPSKNRMVEVKSTWTAEKKKDNIFLKQEAGKKAGYLYEIWVYNGKGERIECFI